MPSLSVFDSITPEQRAAIEQELLKRNFKDYAGFADWLKDLGLEVSRTAAHRFGSKIQKRLQKVKDSTDAARMIADAVPDDTDSRSAAVISLVQSELFDVMVALQDLDEANPEDRVMLLKEAARAIKDMTLASVSNKKFKNEIESAVMAAQLDLLKKLAAFIAKRYPHLQAEFAELLGVFSQWLTGGMHSLADPSVIECRTGIDPVNSGASTIHGGRSGQG